MTRQGKFIPLALPFFFSTVCNFDEAFAALQGAEAVIHVRRHLLPVEGEVGSMNPTRPSSLTSAPSPSLILLCLQMGAIPNPNGVPPHVVHNKFVIFVSCPFFSTFKSH
jgi:hypothetical protein